MQIMQFEDINLSHYSYAIVSDCELKMILIDPARDTSRYLEFATKNELIIAGVIETHPHADFVSSHLELHEIQGATIYVSSLVGASYPFQAFDEGQRIQIGNITLTSLNTPGHSPDSICILLVHNGKQKAVFTGDTLFVGDCGRPDLRNDGMEAGKTSGILAKQMYRSLREKLMLLEDDCIVYPAHGAGTLCGKSLSKKNQSTMGDEKTSNWSLQNQSEEEFVCELLRDQPFVPAYFAYDVILNKTGVKAFLPSIQNIKMLTPVTSENEFNCLDKSLWIVDIRNQEAYKSGHLSQSVNLMMENKFETWLGTIIQPHEFFYLAGDTEMDLREAIKRTAAIGYETQIISAFVVSYTNMKMEKLEMEDFASHPENYTIIDVRNKLEVKDQAIFENSLNIPLAELRDNIGKIPLNKPVVVHCASGFRSAAGSSIIQSSLKNETSVFDLGERVKNFLPAEVGHTEF